MKKTITTIMIFLLVLGLMRVATGVYFKYGTFVPTYESLVNALTYMPDVPLMFNNDFQAVSNAFTTLTDGFSTINSLSTFFVAIGNFFKLGWQITILLADSILIPIQWLIWCFQTLFSIGQ